MQIKVIKGIYKYIMTSPSNRGQKLYRLFLAFLWQMYKRTVNLPIISKLDNGAKFVLEPASSNSTGNIYVKVYEAEYIYFLRKHLQTGGHILDVGAHMGLYTLLLNDKFEGGYLFEPAYDTFRALKTNLFINDFTEKFIAVNAVVSDEERQVSFLKDGVFSGTNRIGIGELSYVIDAIVIDDYLKKVTNTIPKVSFIKIDTEGHELGVLKGAEQTIQSNPDILLLIENSYTDQILDFFKAKNFKIFVIDKQGNIFTEREKFENAYNLIAVGSEHPLYSTL